MEKEYGRGIVGDDQLSMTRFQKQVLLFEEKRQNEKKQEQMPNSSKSPSGPINGKAAGKQGGYTETTRYVNEGTTDKEGVAEFVDADN